MGLADILGYLPLRREENEMEGVGSWSGGGVSGTLCGNGSRTVLIVVIHKLSGWKWHHSLQRFTHYEAELY